MFRLYVPNKLTEVANEIRGQFMEDGVSVCLSSEVIFPFVKSFSYGGRELPLVRPGALGDGPFVPVTAGSVVTHLE